MEQIWEFLKELAATAGLKLLYAILLLVAGMWLIRLIVRLIGKGKLFERIDKSVITFVKSFVRVALYILLLLSVAGILGVPTTSFVTILASAGVAIGLAVQGALSNLAGGLMILFFKPFKVGDYIEVGGDSGVVRDIAIFYTTLITFDNKRITIPNGTLANNTIENHTAEATRRLDMTYSVDYSSDVPLVRRILLSQAGESDLALPDPAPEVVMASHGPSAIDFTLRVWCATENYWKLKFQLTESVKAAFDRAGITIPFDQLDVHLHPQAGVDRR